MTTTTLGVEDVIRLVRPEVRASHEYVVASAPDVTVKLNQNECPLDLPEPIRERLVEVIRTAACNRYPPEVPRRLRATLAERLDHPEEGIIVGNGSNELTYTLGMTFIAPATPVVLPRPMFALYESVVRLYGGSVVPVAPLDSLAFDVAGLVAAMRRTQAPLTIVTTPNNPTGLAIPRRDLLQLIEAAPGAIVVDEAYVEFNPHGTVVDLIDTFPNLIVVRTLSKAFGLAGLRIGYLVAHPSVAGEMMKSRLPFMVDGIAEAAALALLESQALVEARARSIRRWIEELTREMQQIEGVEVVPSATNFVLFRTGADPGDLMVRLGNSGVLVRNMAGYPALKGYLRVSCGTEVENRLFLDALKRAIVNPVAG